MILDTPKVIKPASPRAKWAIPYVHPETYFPNLDHFKHYMANDEALQRNGFSMPEFIFNNLCLLIIEKMWRDHDHAATPFVVDMDKVQDAAINRPKDLEEQALGYTIWLSCAREVLHMQAQCVHISSDYDAPRPKAFVKGDQCAVLHLDDMTFADGSPVGGILVRWVDDDDESALVQMMVSGTPGRWPSPMQSTSIVTDVRLLGDDPVRALENYQKYLIEHERAKPEHFTSMTENMKAIADKVPLILTAWNALKDRDDLLLDVTMPEAGNKPSIAQQIGRDTIPARELGAEFRKSRNRSFTFDVSNRPIWLIG